MAQILERIGPAKDRTQKRVERLSDSQPLSCLAKIDWDSTLKKLVQHSAEPLLPGLGRDAHIQRWLNVEIPRHSSLRVDLLAETTSRDLVHFELQSTNDRHMAVRMLEYAVAIHRAERRYPIQIVIYAGNKPLRMKNVLRGPGWLYRFEMVDLRTVDGTPLLKAEDLFVNMLALLMLVEDKAALIGQIVGRIEGLVEEESRREAIVQLLLTCQMRAMKDLAIKEIGRKMPSMEIDIETDPFLGPFFQKGFAKGRAEGIAEGEARGIAAGEARGKAEGSAEKARELVHRLLTKKFGMLPEWAQQRLASCTLQRLDRIADQLITCTSLEQLLRRPRH